MSTVAEREANNKKYNYNHFLKKVMSEACLVSLFGEFWFFSFFNEDPLICVPPFLDPALFARLDSMFASLSSVDVLSQTFSVTENNNLKAIT